MDSAGVAHPVAEFLCVCFVQCNPIRRSGIQAAGLDQPTINPVINYIGADPKALGHLLDGQLLRTYERGFGNLIAITDPLDHGNAEGSAESADMPFSIKGLGDFVIG